MNIQQLAAEKEREKSKTEVINKINEFLKGKEIRIDTAEFDADETWANYLKPSDVKKALEILFEETYTKSWQDCLNHLAGSEGDVEGLIETLRDEKHLSLEQEDSERCYGFNNAIEHIITMLPELLATHCAKVLSQQHQREIKWSYDGIKYRIHMFYGESEHHCDSDFFTIIGLEKMGIPQCTPPINQ